MYKRWVGKKADLALLSERIKIFFEDKGFVTTTKSSPSQHTLSARPPRGFGVLGRVTVRVLGDSNGFQIEFLASGHSDSAIKLGFLTTMFGGGSLVLRGLKSQEALRELESDFWIYTEEAISRLIDSAS